MEEEELLHPDWNRKHSTLSLLHWSVFRATRTNTQTIKLLLVLLLRWSKQEVRPEASVTLIWTSSAQPTLWASSSPTSSRLWSPSPPHKSQFWWVPEKGSPPLSASETICFYCEKPKMKPKIWDFKVRALNTLLFVSILKSVMKVAVTPDRK